MRADTWKRILSGFLAVLMVLSNVPVVSFASAEDGLCAHHNSHVDCSYREAVEGAACTHVCDESCYRTVTECVHTHGDCGYVAAVAGTPCDHVHGDCGWAEAVAGTPCDHVHGDCGYAEAVPGTPCDHVHGDCGYLESVAGTPCDHVCGEDCAEGCIHRCGDGSCAYSEGIPGSDCTHTCGDGACAYSEGTPGSDCTHVCGDGSCAYSEGTTGSPCTHDCADGTCAYDADSEEIPCGHACTEDSGCITVGEDCHHEHDDTCGYIEAVNARPCDYVCMVCPAQSMIDALPETVTQSNAASVKDALARIDAFVSSMTEEELDQVDFSGYRAAQDALALLETGEEDDGEAVEAVRQMIHALPTIVQLHAMNRAGLDHAYAQTQNAYEAYLKLTEEQQVQLSEELAIVEALMDEFANLKDLDYVIDKAYGPNSQISSAEEAENLWPYAGYVFFLKQTVDGTEYVNIASKDTAVEGQYWLNARKGYSAGDYIYLEPAMDQPGYYYAYTKLSNGTYLYLKSGGYGDYIAVDTTQYNYVWDLEKVNGSLTLMLHQEWGDYYATYKDGYWYLEEAPSACPAIIRPNLHLSHSYTAVETAGSCTTKGYTTHTCSCGLRYWTDFTEDTGHAYDDPTYVWAEDKSAADVTLTCRSCGDIKTQTVASVKEVITAPTCTTPGEYRYSVTVEYGDGNSATRYEYGPAEPTGHETASDGSCVNCDFIGGTFGDGLSWEYSNATGIVKVSGNGAMPDFKNPSTNDSGLSPWYYQTVRGVVIEEGITAIGAYAFAKEPVAFVSLPGTMKTIGDNAFLDCSSLASVNLPQGLETIGAAAFFGTGLTELVIPESVTVIGTSAFSGCTALTSVTVPGSVSEIKTFTFYNCTALKDVQLSEGVTYIGYSAFQGCKALSGVTLPETLTKVDELAFAECYALQEISLPESLTDIGIEAFAVSGLTSVEIPAGITGLRASVFAECENLRSVTIHNSLTSVDMYAFQGTVLTDVYFYGTQAEWEAIAVEENGNEPLANATVHFYTVCGDNHSFENGICTGCGVKAVVITSQPESITARNNASFSVTVTAQGDGLTYQWYGKNASDAEYVALAGKTAATYTSTMVSNWDGRTMYCIITDQYGNTATSDTVTLTFDPTVGGSCGENVTWSLDKTTGVLTISGEGPMADYSGNSGMPWYSYLSSVKNVVIEEGVTTVGARTFRNFTAITELSLPDSLTAIGAGAFYNCRGLTSVTIPGGITELQSGTFCGCENISQIRIPNGVTNIYNDAFTYCYGLKKIVLPVSLTTVDSTAFDPCGLTDVYYLGTEAQWNAIAIGSYNDPLTDANIHYSVTGPCYGLHTEEVIPGTPGDCQNDGLSDGVKCSVCGETLVEQEIIDGGHMIENDICTVCQVYGICGENLTWTFADGTLTVSGTGSMQDYAQNQAPWNSFRNSITRVVIESGVTSLGNNTFYSCANLAEISIPAGVKKIGEYVFAYCTSLTAVEIPANVASIGKCAFAASGLETVEIPASVTSLSDFTFSNCKSLRSAVLPYGLATIGKSAFIGCSSLSDVSLPDSVTEIGVSAFAYTAITSVVIPSGIQALSDSVFQYCSALEYVTFPFALNNIGSNAFYDCDSLTAVTLSDVTNLGDGAFAYCSNLVRVEFGYNLQTIGESTFSGCGKLVYVTVPETVQSIGARAFSGCKSLTEMILPEGLEEIPDGLFDGCEVLTAVTVPSAVTQIGARAFADCSKLGSVNIPAGVTKVGDEAFIGCSGLPIVDFPESLESIGSLAFADDAALTSITFAGDAPVIAGDAFRNVTATAYYLSSASGWTADVKQSYGGQLTWKGSTNQGSAGPNVRWVYEEDTKNLLIYGSGDMYDFGFYYNDKPIPWESVSSQIETVTVKSGVTSIGSHAFYNCTALYEVTLPDGITSIGSNAFYECDELMEIKLPATVRQIGDYAFYGCDLITSMVIPVGVTEIPDAMCYMCTRLESVTIPETVTTIGERAFETCTSLTSINLHSGLTSIGNNAFSDCDRITEVNIPGSIAQIPGGAFSGCEALTTVVMNPGTTTIGQYAFGSCSNLTNVTIPEGLTTIGETAFSYCALTEVDIPSTVTGIGFGAFRGNDFTSVVIPEGVRRIYGSTFAQCYYLETVSIPASVKYIDEEAFDSVRNGIITFLGSAPSFVYNCFTGAKLVCFYPYGDSSWTSSKLQSYEGSSVTWCPYGTVGESVSWKLDETGTLTLSGAGSIPDYELSGPWAAFSDRIYRIVVEDGVTAIGGNAFTGCSGAKTVEFLGSAPAIADNAFTGITAIALHYMNDEAWSSVAGKNYGGKLTWLDESNVIASGTNNDVLKWTLNAEGTLYIYGQGEMNGYGTTPSWLSYQTQIRKVIIAEGVTHIGYYAFSGCTNLETVVIPSTVTSFNQYAFNHCASLREITIPDGVKSIPGRAFYGCSSLQEITIPASVTELGISAFSGCSQLSTIVFEGSVPTLPGYQYNTIFSGVPYQARVYYPAGDSSWTEEVFNKLGPKLIWIAQGETENNFHWYVDNYGTLQILGTGAMPDYIGNAPWADYASVIRRVKFDALITHIGSNVLAGCPNVQLMTFGNPAPTFSDTAFAGVTAYACYTGSDRSWTSDKLLNYGGQITWQNVANTSEEVLCGDKLTYVLDEYGTMFIFGTGEMDEDSTYWKQSGFPVKKVIITEGATNIAESAFSGCKDLTEIVLPETLTSIGWYALQGSNLTQIRIPEKVTSIGWYAFSGCTGLTSVNLPEGLTELGQYAFMDCTALTSVNIPASLTTLSAMIFSNTGLTEFTVPGTVTEVKNAVISGCKNLTSVTFEEGVTTIGSHMFSNCPALETVVFPASVTSVGGNLFEDSPKYKKVWFHGDMPTFEEEAFADLRGIVYYPSGAEGWEGRPDCPFVTWQPYCSDQHVEEVIPAVEPTCTSTGLTEGKKCSVCDMILVEQQVAPAAHKYENGICTFCGLLEGDLGEGLTATFDDENGVLTISGTGPMKNFGSSDSSIPWYGFRDEISSVEIGSGVTSVGNGAFWGCSNMTKISIPEGVTYIGVNAFDSCYQLSDLTLPSTLTQIEMGAFSACMSLPAVEIPAGVQVIPAFVFSTCVSLKEIILPEGVTTIENGAFYLCDDLTSIRIPASVTAIGSMVFDGCKALQSVTFVGSAPAIGEKAFNGVTANAYYPADDTSWNEETMLGYGGTLTWLPSACSGGHTEVIDPAVDATCTEDGLTEGKHCSVCNTVLVEQEVIPAGHKIENDLCTLCGVYGTCGENLTWTFDKHTGTLTVSGNGEMRNFSVSTAPWNSLKPSIVTVILESGVTSVGQHAFRDCPALTEVEFAASVCSISYDAFRDCTALASVAIPEKVTAIGSRAFSGCSSLKEIVIPAGVTGIGSGAFQDCSSLISVQIPEGVTKIEQYTFSGCSSLERVTLSAKTKSIGDRAFYDCTKLTAVTLPDTVASLGVNAFGNCSSLTEMNVPAGVTSIGDYTFAGCTSLVRVELKEGVTAIGSRAFNQCKSLVYLTIPSTVRTIGQNAFYNCSSLTAITLPEGLTEIPESLFAGCSKLDTVSIPSTVTTIGKKAFWANASLQNIALPAGLTSIGDDAFYNAPLVSIVFPETLTYIGRGAFGYCYQLRDITFTGDAPVFGINPFDVVTATAYYLSSNTTWTADVLQNYGGTITWKGSANQGYAGENVRWVYEEDTRTLMLYGSGPMYDYNYSPIPWESFRDEIEELVIKSGVTTIGNLAFQLCKNLYTVTLPEGITSIGDAAFENCEELMEVILPDTVRSIGTNAFYGCSTLLYLDIPEGVTKIPDYMCYGCVRMENLSIPETVTSIGDGAFYDCRSLAVLKLPSSLTSIETWAFNGCSRITEVSIPAGITTITNGAFANCGALKKVTLNSAVTDIGDSAFSGCYSLTDINFPEGLKSIGVYAFSSTAIKKLQLPNTVTSIRSWAFDNSQVEEVVIPNSIRRIYEGTFQDCYNLRSVIIPESVKLIDANSFHAVNNCEITFLGSAPSFAYNSFTSSDLVCYYPYGDSSWTSSKLQSYEGSSVVWCPYGTPEENVSWKIDENGVLILSGPGEIADFENKAPWATFADRISRVVIEEGITVIGANAFTGCTSLRTVDFKGKAPSVADTAFTGITATVLYRIADAAWANVSGKHFGGKLTWIDCSSEVDSGTDGFNIAWTLNADGILVIYGFGKMDEHGNGYGWLKNETIRSSIREVVILEGISNIGFLAFNGCRNLKKVTIASTVAVIRVYAFQNCESLEKIDLPAGLTTVEDNAFYYCEKLTSVTIPAAVTAIGYQAFYGCQLNTVVFEGSAYESFESDVFYHNGATKAYYPANDASWTQEVRERLGNNLTWISYNTAGEEVLWNFDHNTGTLNIFGQGVVDENVAAAWANVAASARTVIIRDGITAISANVMNRCSNAKYIFFDGSAPSIDANAFSGMTATVFYPDRDQTWLNATGHYGGSLTWVSFNGLKASGTSGNSLYWAIDRTGHLYVYGSGDMPDYQHSDGKYAPWYGQEFRKATMLKGLTSIGTYAFAYSDLTEVVIPEGVTVIRNDAFRSCEKLTSVTIPGTVKTIEMQCFESCQGLRELVLQEGIESIGWNVFYGCTGLKKLTIPASVRSIGYQAFCGCSYLNQITFLGDAPEIYQMSWSDGKALFDGVTAVAYYPANNATWTREVMQDYGGTITWICEACVDGHTPETVAAMEPGCETTGLTEGRKCSVCGMILVEQTELPATGHDFRGEDVICSGCGAAGVRLVSDLTDMAAPEGEYAYLNIEAEGSDLIYQWFYRNPSDSEFQENWLNSNGYEVQMNSYTNGQQVYCVITDRYNHSVQTSTVTVSMVPAPVIIRDLVDAWAEYGANAIVSLQAEGEGLTYQWYVYDHETGEYHLDGAFHGSSYSLRMDEKTDGTIVYCKITDQYGQSIQSCTAWLHVLSKPLSATVDQSLARVKAGEMAKIIVNAEGDGQLRYEWYWQAPGSDDWNLTTSFKGNTYSVEMNESRNGRQVYCMVCDAYGSSWQTEIVTLSMIEERTELKIVSQPKSVTVAEGVKAITTVKAEGDGLTYNWYYKDKHMDSFQYTASFRGASYSVEMNDARHGRQVYCEITDKYGNMACTEVATLSMIGVTIVKQPVSVKAFEGETAKVSFEAQGEGLTYTWYYKEANSTKFYKTTAFTGNSYSVTMNDARNGRQVYCVVTDKYGNTRATNTVKLTMLEEIQSGQCGDYGYMIWELNVKTGVLTIQDTGHGNEYMGDWEPVNIGTGPWYEFRQYIKTAHVKGKVRNIGDGAFYDCYNLTSVTMTDTVETIGQRAFSGCSSLKRIVMPAAVKHVSAYVFENCPSLDTVIFRGSAPSFTVLSFDGSYPFTAYYTDDGSWNGRLQNYGGDVTWKEMQELKILTQPKSVSVAEGEKASVTVKAQGDGLTYTWYFKDAGASKFSKTTSFKGNSYSVEMNAVRDGRQVYCVINDQYGNTVKTNTVTLSMAVPKTELKIIQQPASVTVNEGVNAVATVKAQGDGLTYAWYFKDTTHTKFYLTTSFKGASYTVQMNEARNGRQVYCIITDQYGDTVQSNTVTLSMAETKTELKITQQPVSVEVAEGANAVATVRAQGDGLTYQWYFKDTTHTKFYLTTSFKGASYTVQMNESRNGRQVYCVITDQYGDTVQSNTVTLSMAETKTELKITQQPVSVTAEEGVNAIATVKAQGDGLTYQWYFKDTSHTKFYLTTSFKGASYTVQMNESRNGRQVYCVITDQYGDSVRSNTVTLSMTEKKTELKIIKQPVSVAVASGETAKITFEAQGDGLTYAWYFRNAGASKFLLTTTFTGNAYSTKMDGTRNGRQVYCVVTDKNGNSVTTDTVTMYMGTALKITKQPVSAYAVLGEEVAATVEAQGDGLTYQWYYKDTNQSKFYLTGSFKTETYHVQMTEARNGRQIYCVITDQYGNSVTTNTVTLSKRTPLDVTIQSDGETDSRSYVAVEAEGDGLSYQWYYRVAGEGDFILSDTETDAYYVVSRLDAVNGYEVYCVVTDAYGESVTTETITIKRETPTLLRLITQPSSVAVKSGETAVLSIHAEGDDLSYAWYYKDTDDSSFIQDETNINQTIYQQMSSSNSGRQIYCVVTDGYGNSVQTDVVTLFAVGETDNAARVNVYTAVRTAPSSNSEILYYVHAGNYVVVERTENVMDWEWGYISVPAAGWIDMSCVD